MAVHGFLLETGRAVRDEATVRGRSARISRWPLQVRVGRQWIGKDPTRWVVAETGSSIRRPESLA